jgi:hypothetical protein
MQPHPPAAQAGANNERTEAPAPAPTTGRSRFTPSLRSKPENGLCLSALHDGGWARGLVTVLPDLTTRASRQVRSLAGLWLADGALLGTEGARVRAPEKFHPDAGFVRWLRREHVAD